MKKVIFLFSALFLLTLSAQAEIREVATMKAALSGIHKGDVVVLDIDNTILEPTQTLGSDQWFEYLLEKNKQIDSETAFENTRRDWIEVQKVTNVELVEQTTPKLVRTLQAKGIMVLALTARPETLANVTAGQLRVLGVEFKTYSGFGSNETVYNSGVLYAGSKNKGLVLRDFFSQLNIKPNKLVFVDDKVKNVNNMDAEFGHDVFPNINFRYAAADPKVKSFSKEIAELQWSYFIDNNVLITDLEAQKILGLD